MSDDSQTLQPNATFGKHRIVCLLGRGGMGEVYEVEHELTGKRHAIKLLSPDVMEQAGALERFRKEARVMARLEHAGIVRVDDSGEDEGRHWLRMELMNGRETNGRHVVTLEEYVAAQGGRLAETEVKALLGKILDALGHAHGKGLVHRDLKLANVLFDGEDVKIADFGLVNAAGAEWMDTQVRSTVINPSEEDTLIDSGGTGSRSRAIMGTYAYMSPEQKKGLPADFRSDLYAVGLMTFRMLTGEETPGMERASELGLGLDKGWDNWLIQALKSRPDDRFATAAAMREALDFRAVAPATAARPTTAPEPVEPTPQPKPEQVAAPSQPIRRPPQETVESASQSRSGVYWALALILVAVSLFAWSPWSDDNPRKLTVPILTGKPTQGEGFALPDLELEMLWCPPGTFTMGSPASEADRVDDETRHTVTLTEGFWLGKYEVTQAQWESIMGSNPSHFVGSNLPVENVSWDEVTLFCAKLTERERKAGRLPEGYAYQLPTEAQWEYACRAGTKTAFSFGNSITAKQANYNDYVGQTTAVGSYPANAWGFHDMHGNVWEWCRDRYGDYPSGTVTDLMGPADGSERVLRGGSWNFIGQYLRSANRNGFGPGFRSYYLGFRPSLRLVQGKAE